MTVAIVLFTRDLRVHDNPALAAAVREAEHVLPVFVLDERLLRRSPARAALLTEALDDLDRSLGRLGGALVVRRGDPVAETVRLAREHGARTVFAADDVSAYAQRRRSQLADALDLRVTPGVTVVPPGAVAPQGRDHYRVFTPYHHAWSAAPRRALEAVPHRISLPPGLERRRLPRGTGYGETAARAAFERWLEEGDARYAERRDLLSEAGTSRLSVALHLGLISPLEVVIRSESPELVRQLAWRDFFAQLLAANPWSATRDLYPRRHGWNDDPDALAAWKEGQTGYPMVDAGMRELAATGFMHGRARLITASFLTKHLEVDWRLGAEHFAELLLDGDVASNTGNWQWVAGTGVDTRPGRRLNPVRQARRFDPKGEYVRRWVPELDAISGPAVHEPWLLDPRATSDYPAPIADPPGEPRR